MQLLLTDTAGRLCEGVEAAMNGSLFFIASILFLRHVYPSSVVCRVKTKITLWVIFVFMSVFNVLQQKHNEREGLRY
jgi:hypothetical protein